MPKRNNTPKSKSKKSSRIKKRSLRGKESDEYLLACGEIEGISDGNKDVISGNEDALAISGNKNALADNTILDESIVACVNEVIPCSSGLDVVASENVVVVASGDNDVVASVDDDEINRGAIFKTDCMTLPEGVVEFDSQYVKDISFAIDGGEKMKWEYLNKLYDLHEYGPEFLDSLCHWPYDVSSFQDLDLNNGRNQQENDATEVVNENFVSHSSTPNLNCVSCIEFENTICDEYEVEFRKKTEEIEKLKQEINLITKEKEEWCSEVKKLTMTVLELRQQIKKSDIRINELSESDHTKRE